ncbi:hypothetical protein QCA50_008362 [Cerrena zonata]|uniref:tRNA-guanine(15) transglycosylase-like domain-containing protein n=1 Tax=Cerrena zonata TaxID=2478898 RepID=A0AAW0G8X9_9APHY
MSSLCAHVLAYSQRSCPIRPRLGTLSLQRLDGSSTPEIQTPGFITTSSRGVVPHLSRDHVRSTPSIRWTNIPFESFLDRMPPVPTLQPGSDPLHTFTGFPSKQHILSLSLRDPFDGREMPANNKQFVSAYCIRGVRKVTPADWKKYALACKPDLVVALSDVPYTSQPHSQKRATKSIERSTAWLADFLRPIPSTEESKLHRPDVLVNLVGGLEPRARTSFSESLVETLHGKEQEQIHPLHRLDEGVSGYIIDLLPLRLSRRLETFQSLPGQTVLDPETYVELARASLAPLPQNKVRIAYSTSSPHEILRFIRGVGIDLFDSHWAQRAAHIGVALDFRFPVISDESSIWNEEECSRPRVRSTGKRELGHNLYLEKYSHQHVRLASSFLDGTSPSSIQDAVICPCELVHQPLHQPTSLTAMPMSTT